jgi:NitT/TauT family transport system permease protein
MSSTKSAKSARVFTAIAIPLVSLAAVLVVWDLSVRIFDIAPYVLPSPQRTFTALQDDWDTLSVGASITSREFITGFLIGALAGFVFALAMSWSRLIQRLIYPVLITSQAVPIIAVAPALVIWMGFGLAPKLTIVALIVFFPVVVNVLDGLAAVDKDLVALATAMGGTRWRIFRSVTLPATLTPLFSALKMSATFAVTGAVLGEWTASTSGGAWGSSPGGSIPTRRSLGVRGDRVARRPRPGGVRGRGPGRGDPHPLASITRSTRMANPLQEPITLCPK